jgi:pimeloyl-ACP methyl ester carboxylesterase
LADQGFEGRIRLHKGPTPAKAWVIFIHGNSGTACDRAHFATTFAELPLHWVYFEYPGFAGDPERPSVTRTLEAAEMAWNSVQKENTKGLPVLVWGESLGTGVAVYLASRHPEVRGVILQTPYTSISDIAARRYPFYPVRSLIREDFRAGEWAPQVKAPALVYHSRDDRTIPFDLGRALFDRLGSAQKVFAEFAESGHIGFRSHGEREKYLKSVTEFVGGIQ